MVEAFSLRGLGRLAEAWKATPPFPGDNAYGDAIARYRQDVIDKYRQLGVEQGGIEDFGAWFARLKGPIEAEGGLNAYAQAAAPMILAEYERTPRCVEALGALNRWPGRSGVSLADYLRDWDASCHELGASSALPSYLRRTLGVVLSDGPGAPRRRDPTGQSEMKLPFAVQRAAKLCPDVTPENIARRLNYSSYVNVERRYMYFEVPKAACSTMKWLLHSIEKAPPIKHFVGPNREARRDMFIHARENLPIPSLLQLDDELQEFVLTSPEVMRFTVVRNPYTRLESAWKDKVQLCAPRYEDLCIEIKGALPTGDDPASQVSFDEFVTAVEGQDIARCDSHWRSQWEHTLRGAMNFSHIGRTEDLPALLASFFDHIGEPNRAVPQLNAIDRDTEYTDEIAARVYRLYRRDFEAFDYARDSWPRPPRASEPGPIVPLDRFIDEVLERNIVIGHLYAEREELTRRLSTWKRATVADDLPRTPSRCRRLDRPANTPSSRPTTRRAARFSNAAFGASGTRRSRPITSWSRTAFRRTGSTGPAVRHIRLDRSHGDFGDTPRGIGAMLAAQEGYEGIGFLDADCWLEPDHVEYCLELASQAGPDACDYVIALRHERRPDGSLMQVNQVPPHRHVDTNCFFFLRSGFHVLPVWAAIPREVSAVGDRLFYNAVRANGLRPTLAERKTVNYTCMWESIYRVMGEEPPEGAKPNPDHQAIERWIKERSPAELAAIDRSIQTPLEQLYPLYKDATTTPISKPAPLRSGRPARAVKRGSKTICLSMIVKNEAPVIARCLNSVRPSDRPLGHRRYRLDRRHAGHHPRNAEGRARRAARAALAGLRVQPVRGAGPGPSARRLQPDHRRRRRAGDPAGLRAARAGRRLLHDRHPRHFDPLPAHAARAQHAALALRGRAA